MRFQLGEEFCGPACITAATRALGNQVSQSKAAKLAGTTLEEGTDEDGIRRALLASGFIPEHLGTSITRVARNWLVVKLRLGYPVILCHGKQRWQHWVTAIGMLGSKFIVFDPARFEYRVNSGVQIISWQTLSRLWYANHKTRGKSPAYYGVAVLTKENG